MLQFAIVNYAPGMVDDLNGSPADDGLALWEKQNTSGRYFKDERRRQTMFSRRILQRKGSDTETRPKKKRPPLKFGAKPILTAVMTFGVVFTLASSFRSVLADWGSVSSGSMRPTILEGDRVLVNKLAYRLSNPVTQKSVVTWGEPERGDVIVFKSPTDGTRLIKRVVGRPGDTVAVKDNRLYVNGDAATYDDWQLVIEETRGTEDANRSILTYEELDGNVYLVLIRPGVEELSSFEPITVPDNRFFVLGDNRTNSVDSRWFGFVHREEIEGRATVMVSPGRAWGPISAATMNENVLDH